MNPADLHMHTCYSHGRNSPWEMHVAAENKGLSLIGFSEHSPRPLGYDYTREYRDQLARYFDTYIREALAVKKQAAKNGGCQVLLGLEMDWLSGQEDFIKKACSAHDYDYLIGSVHFLDKWGFDDSPEPWQSAGKEQRFAWYKQYFHVWKDMLASGLFQIAAHPDLIKIFSIDSFHEWLRLSANREMVREAILTLRNAGMAMEISSAGWRKPCAEVYPAPAIMEMAAEAGVMISIASDAHNAGDVGADFDRLVHYARSYGFDRQTYFVKGRHFQIPF